jgi:NAD(P)-dependent dehydrogenase (short-subunit alcohol dehydrogenase family)
VTEPLSNAPPHRPSGCLEGLTAVVTGAASGVGLTTTCVLVAEGATVVASDLPEPLDQAEFT